MKKENTSIRLKKIMSDKNLRQVDILNMTTPYCEKYGVKMNKSDISQYCSGKTEPNQDKLFVLGIALGVNEAWLMGYDVPMERNDYEFKDTSGKAHLSFDNVEDFKKAYDKSKYRNNKLMTAIINNAEKLDIDSKKSLLDYSYFLLDKTNQNLNVNAAHERTDVEVTEEMIEHDNEIMKGDNF